jgi:hypothetical protein
MSTSLLPEGVSLRIQFNGIQISCNSLHDMCRSHIGDEGHTCRADTVGDTTLERSRHGRIGLGVVGVVPIVVKGTGAVVRGRPMVEATHSILFLFLSIDLKTNRLLYICVCAYIYLYKCECECVYVCATTKHFKSVTIFTNQSTTRSI